MASILSAILNFLLTFNFIVWALICFAVFGVNFWTISLGVLSIWSIIN